MGLLFAPYTLRRVSFLSLLTLASPASAASYMEGAWFGQGQPSNKDSMYIDHMRPDGSWRGEYRFCAKGKAVDRVQEGHWTLSGDTLSIQVDTLDGASAPRTDVYKILAHSPTSQKYLSLGWNFPYESRRVSDDFKMPSCHA